MILSSLSKSFRTIFRRKDKNIEKPNWYRSQGDNPTNCGDTVINMIYAIYEMEEKRFSDVFIWTISQINSHISNNITESSLTNIYNGILPQGDCFIMTINSFGFIPHFVVVTRLIDSDDLMIADPMSGCRIQTWKNLRKELSYSTIIKVW